MQAIALIGSKGTRLRPITHTVPKAMIPLRNRPYFCYMLESLRAASFGGAVLSIGYLPAPIRDYFGGGEELGGFSLESVVKDRTLGAAGGVKNVEPYLDGGPFISTNGDILEKPACDEVTTSLINASIYVHEPEVLRIVPAGREVSIEREVFPRLQSMGKLRAHVSSPTGATSTH